MLPVVAIIGRPNVGKSALFNRLIARRTNLVDATPGLTRDRLYGDVQWRGLHFRVVDTGGLQFAKGNALAKAMEAQVAKAMEEAALALFVCDAKEGLTPLDSHVADWVRPWAKPTLLVVNKVDADRDAALQNEFFQLGMGEPFALSALHGLRVGELLDAVVENLKSVSDTKQKPVSDTRAVSDTIRVAIVGRPNVGKSSLVNRILNEERVLVDAAPGTTRDPVDSYLTVGDERYCLIDTAGIRAKRRLKTRIDAIARLKALETIERADVCLGVLDASCGIIQDDLKLLDKVVAAGRPICLVVNKWDLVAQSMDPEVVTQGIARRAPFLRFYPVVCASAKSGYNVLRASEQAKDLAHRARRRISDEERQRLLEFLQADAKAPAVLRSGRITQIVQVGSAPPTFHVSARVKGSLRPSDLAFLEGVFRRVLELGGVPIRIRLLRKGRRARR
jgi:GTP-binding protein